MSPNFLLAIDQGTSATKAILFDEQGKSVVRASRPIDSIYPQAGFVEQNPGDIYSSVLEAVKECLQIFEEEQGGSCDDIAACGISNQRETFLLWDSNGKPITNAVIWQCKRSVDICKRLRNSDFEDELRKRTGLIADPYFSGTKLLWLYEKDITVREVVDKGGAYFGTIDTWLLYQLTGGREFKTDYTNASRTLLFNIDSLEWDEFLLKEFHCEKLNLPEPHCSTDTFGYTNFEGISSVEIPVTAMIGDSHAASFGEQCFLSGDAKATLGTGSSILLNTSDQRVRSENGMMSTINWSVSDRVDYALEGVIVTCGGTITWLRDQLGLFASSEETLNMATSVEDNGGVYLIPAFSGLGAPHWKMDMKGMIVGLTFGTNKNHLVRAALESIPYQIKDVITAMEKDSGIPLRELKVDGGITNNSFVMQFLADLLQKDVVNIGISDVSAMGAAYLAGLGSGVFRDLDHLQTLPQQITTIQPDVGSEDVTNDYMGWKEALGKYL